MLSKSIFSVGTKESAYIHALTSAGIAYAITKACSTGRLSSCGCDMSLVEKNSNSSIRWAGCSDNVLFGSELARKFVNLRERVSRNRTSLLNVHNNQVGIRVRKFEEEKISFCNEFVFLDNSRFR